MANVRISSKSRTRSTKSNGVGYLFIQVTGSAGGGFGLLFLLICSPRYSRSHLPVWLQYVFLLRTHCQFLLKINQAKKNLI